MDVRDLPPQGVGRHPWRYFIGHGSTARGGSSGVARALGRQPRGDGVGVLASPVARASLGGRGSPCTKAALPLTEQHLETDPIKFKALVRPSEQCKPDASSEGVTAWEPAKPVEAAEFVEHTL